MSDIDLQFRALVNIYVRKITQQCHELHILITRLKNKSFLGPPKFVGTDKMFWEIEKMAAGSCLFYYLKLEV